MKPILLASWLPVLAAVPCLAAAALEQRGETVVFSGATYAAAFRLTDGSLLRLGPRGQEGTIVRSGEHGLWHARFRDGSETSASAFGPGTPGREFACEPDAAAGLLRLTYRSPELTVAVTVRGRDDGLELVAELQPQAQPVLEFGLPARLRCGPAQLERLIVPMNGNESVGTAFRRPFFARQPEDDPSAWRPQVVGAQGYEALYGGPLDQRPDADPPVSPRTTPTGLEWLGPGLAARVDASVATVNRASTRDQADLVLVDSDHGPWLAASHLGGAGLLFRIGGPVGGDEQTIATDAVAGVLERLAAQAPPERRRIGLIALRRGPSAGGWASVPVATWRERLQRVAADREVPLAELTTPQELLEALGSREYVAILNPYGEWAPVPVEGGMPATVAAVGAYVREGGNWFEVGGYPFFYALEPVRFLEYGTSYPDAFADFLHWDTGAGSASVYRVQPRDWEPWAGASDRAAIFVPGRLACGGDEAGGWADRPFGTYVAPGETWRCPAVRLTVGNTAAEGLQAYCAANRIERRLNDKMPPALLDRFRQAVLVYYGGDCAEKLAHLEQLPVPTLIHFADYLRGGFDQQYPDHLPPRPEFGTAEELRRLFDQAHAMGHLVMPYTNPTWWCDDPRGPTFEREGEAPLLRTLDGGLSPERYAANTGFTTCFWHPAVRAANRETLRQFTDEFPVDVLFQDQCGARGWLYDTNPASPTPVAYAEGLLSMVAEDSRTKPLSTESGWDQVVNYEAQLSGMSWRLVPTEGGPSWRRLMAYDYPPEAWEVFPLAQYIAHDKCAMIYHDLGQFVTNREVLSWTLGLGFGMTYAVSAASLDTAAPREWLRWLDRVQKSVCARYLGEPVVSFEHDRGPDPTVEDMGVLRAAYGPVQVVANLGPRARAEAGHELPPYGFVATAPGVFAADLARLADRDFGEEGLSFAVEGDEQRADAWVYAPPEAEVAVPVPAGMTGRVRVRPDGADEAVQPVEEGVVRFRLPTRPGKARAQPPPALAGKAPRDWPGAKPAIGVVDLGPAVRPTWTDIAPGDWVEAFGSSALATEYGLPVERLTTMPALTAALQAGPTQWFCLINPYGEGFPVQALDEWRAALDLLRSYVENGGSWWETGGYSFYVALAPGADGWEGRAIGGDGIGHLGLPVGGGEVDQPAEPLTVTAIGRAVLGEALSTEVEALTSTVNRGLVRGSHDPGHTTLVAGRQQDFIGAYRLGGWGYLWRVGGFRPNPRVVLPVAVAATVYTYTHPPLPQEAGGTKYLHHAVIEARPEPSQRP